MPDFEPTPDARHSTRVVQPRQPYVEIAELIATAIARMRHKNSSRLEATDSEVSLGFTANQRVNTNPSYTEGVNE